MEKMKKLASILLTIVIIASTILLTCSYVLMIGRVESSSMEPEIKSGDVILANRLAYKVRKPARGDVIAFYLDGEILIKRIVGLPGEKVSFIDGYVYINDKLLKEPYIDEEIETNSNEIFEVPKGQYFVLGDNREESLDSRYVRTTYIKKEKMIGRVFLDNTRSVKRYRSKEEK